ncbi:hypothetical protein [Spongiimicrobium salis]|uniref:hypothetical protein n=1 Tax=Spongiimicrobium salis TaxID=1667022 RepID=UPI00374D54B9
MNTFRRRKALFLIPFGLFLIAAAQISSYYLPLSDGLQGGFMGLGVGLLLTPLIIINSRSNGAS